MTLYFDEKLTSARQSALEASNISASTSIGAALQVGGDIALGKDWVLGLDPLVYGVTIGRRFSL